MYLLELRKKLLMLTILSEKALNLPMRLKRRHVMGAEIIRQSFVAIGSIENIPEPLAAASADGADDFTMVVMSVLAGSSNDDFNLSGG